MCSSGGLSLALTSDVLPLGSVDLVVKPADAVTVTDETVIADVAWGLVPVASPSDFKTNIAAAITKIFTKYGGPKQYLGTRFAHATHLEEFATQLWTMFPPLDTTAITTEESKFQHISNDTFKSTHVTPTTAHLGMFGFKDFHSPREPPNVALGSPQKTCYNII